MGLFWDFMTHKKRKGEPSEIVEGSCEGEVVADEVSLGEKKATSMGLVDNETEKLIQEYLKEPDESE